MKVLAFVIISGFLGGCMLWFGRRGKRVGPDPHCPRCDYNLTHAPLPRCPECGHDFSVTGPAVGRLHPRWAFLLLGMVAVVLALAFVWPAYMETRHDLRYKYYRYWPAAMIMRDLPGQHRHYATSELSRRLAASQLSASQIQCAVDAIAAQLTAKQSVSGIPGDLLDTYADLVQAGAVEGSERMRAFFGWLEWIEFSADPNWAYVKLPDSRHISFMSYTHMPRRKPYTDFLACRTLRVLSIDGRPAEAIRAQGLTGVAAQRGLLSLGTVPTRQVQIAVTARWYDVRGTPLEGLQPSWDSSQQALAQALALKPLCTLDYTVTVEAAKGWKTSVEPQPMRRRATTQSAPSGM